MSILNGPRLNFWGGIRTDVSVPNNSPTITYNNQKSTLNLFDLTTSTLAAEAQHYSDDQLNQMINAPLNTNTPNSGYTAAGWNHYGQHVVDLQNVLISSQGAPGAISTSGDLVGQPVYLLGSVDPVTGQGPFSGPMMVDLDPSSTQTTQIYVGGLQIGSSASPELLIRCNTVCSSQDLALRILVGEPDAPGSNRISGTFQLFFPLSSIVSYNKSSAMLQSIIEAPGATGIVVRFVMFEMCPTLTTAQLNADYAAGTDSPNPSIGRIIGTLAPAFANEPQICQAGRQLQNVSTGATGYMDTANALLSIDMVNLIPKAAFRLVRTDITSPIGPNIDFGTLNFTAGATSIGSLNCTDAVLLDYYLYGGLVDLPLNSTQLAAFSANPLSITGLNSATSAHLKIAEMSYRVFSDQRNIYIDDYQGNLTITLTLKYLGQNVQQATEISIQSRASGPLPNPDYLNFPDTVTVMANQPSVSFTVATKTASAATAGFEALNYSCNGGSYFTNFRKYSQTDFGIAAGTTITWELMYPNVLRFHYLAFPAMSRYIPLNQPDAIMGAKNSILARTSDAYKGTTLYMPVVRSMSPSQVALLTAYLTGQPWQPNPPVIW
jgi:hypothetical protein